MLRSLGTVIISISFIIILFCDISDGVKKIRYRKIQNPKSNGLFGGDSTADIYGFLNRISNEIVTDRTCKERVVRSTFLDSYKLPNNFVDKICDDY